MEKNDLIDFLANYYQVRVVYYADQELDNLCRKLTGCSMPEKFSVFIDNAYVRDINGTVATSVQRRIGFRFIDARALSEYNKTRYEQAVAEWYDDASPSLDPFLSEGVSHAYNQSQTGEQGNILLSTMQNCPWYPSYRSAVIETCEASEIEFTSSCVSCVFLTAETAENASSNLVNLARQHDERSSTRLSNAPQSTNPACPVGPCRHLLMPCPRCCAVIFSPSSSSDSSSKLNASVEQARTVLPGLMTQAIPFVPIDNSVAAKPSTIIAGLFARLARDVVLPSLLQWSERHIMQLADMLNSRRGISTSLRTIFSAGSKPSAKIGLPTRGSSGTLVGPNGQPMGGSSADVVYTDESTEIQMRRLSDLAFLMGAFEIAFEGYHRLKDDFQRDQALLPQATALEAAAIALLMHPQPPSKRFPATCLKYLETAFSLYQSLSPSSPRAQYMTTRCGLLYADTLRALKMFPEAAAVFTRLAPDATSPMPEFELRSAICLEQAAHCWGGMRRMRKAALHLLLSGARYSRAQKKKHSLRCYQTALPTYAAKGLALAEDHVLLTIGRQAYTLKDHQTAVEAFAGLLRHHNDTKNNHQNATIQMGFIREYLWVAMHFQNAMKAPNDVVMAPVPVFPSTCILIDPTLVSQPAPLSLCLPGPEDWQSLASLEEPSIKALLNSVVIKPTTFLFPSEIRGKVQKAPDTPFVFASEQFLVLVDIENPLDIALTIANVTLTGVVDADAAPQGQDQIPKTASGQHNFGRGETSGHVTMETPNIIDLQPRQCGRFAVRITCSIAGKLKINAICGQLSVPSNSMEQDSSAAYVTSQWPLSTPWTIDVCEPTGCIGIQVSVDDNASPFIPGTLLPMKITFKLSGEKAGSDFGVRSVVLTTNRSDCVQLLDGFSDVPSPPPPPPNSQQAISPPPVDTNKSWRVLIPESAAQSSMWTLNALVRIAPSLQEVASSVFSFSLLLAYEPIRRTGRKRYRLAPILVKLPICETPFLLSVAATPHPSSPIGLLNIRDCELFSLGFSASLMAMAEGQQQVSWAQLLLQRLALISSSINVDSSKMVEKYTEDETIKSLTRVVNTVVVSRRGKPLEETTNPVYISLLSQCSLSTIIGFEKEQKKSVESALQPEVYEAIVRMAVCAHKTSVFSNVSSASRLHGIFVFQWDLVSQCGRHLIRGCNFVVDPPLFPGDQFSSAVFAASDPSISARRLAFGLNRLSTQSTAGFPEGFVQAPVVVHLEYPQVVQIENKTDQVIRIPASIFCRNRSSCRVELVDCNLPIPQPAGSSEDAFGTSGLLWLAPKPIWPVSLEPGDGVTIPLVLLATHVGVFRPLPPSVEVIVPPSSNKVSFRPDFGPFMHLTYSDSKKL